MNCLFLQMQTALFNHATSASNISNYVLLCTIMQDSLISWYVNEDVVVDTANNNPLFLAFGLQKEFTLIKVAVAGIAVCELSHHSSHSGFIIIARTLVYYFAS